MLKFLIYFIFLISILLINNNTFASENNDNELINIIENVKPGKKIKLSLQNDGIIEGMFYKYTRDSIYVLNDQTTSSLPISAINKFWVRSRATKKGALLGLKIGGGLALSFGILMLAHENKSDTPTGLGVLVFSGGSLVGGLLTGTAIGVTLNRWNLKYQKTNDNKHVTLMTMPEKIDTKTLDKDTVKQNKSSPKKAGSLNSFIGFSYKFNANSKGYYGLYFNYLISISPNISIGPEIGLSNIKERTIWGYWEKEFQYFASIVKISRDRKISPFIILGVGVGSGVLNNSFNYHLGGGVEFYALPHIHLITEARWHDIVLAGETSFFQLRAGIGFHW